MHRRGARHADGAPVFPLSPLYLPYISPISPLYLPYTSPTSPYISRIAEEHVAQMVRQYPTPNHNSGPNPNPTPDPSPNQARQYPGVRLAADPKRELTADPMHTTKGIRHASDLLGYLDTGVCAAAVAPLDEPRPNPHPHPSPSP